MRTSLLSTCNFHRHVHLGFQRNRCQVKLHRTADEYSCGDNMMSFGVTCLFGKIRKFWFSLRFSHLKSHPKICIEGSGWDGESVTSVQGIWCVTILLLPFPMEMSSCSWLVLSKLIRKDPHPNSLHAPSNTVAGNAALTPIHNAEPPNSKLTYQGISLPLHNFQHAQYHFQPSQQDRNSKTRARTGYLYIAVTD